MTKPLTANAAQCRKALLTLTTDKIRASAKSLGWALLSTLQAEGVRFSGRAIVEEALDWDATLLMQRYCEASKEARANDRGILDDAGRALDASVESLKKDLTPCADCGQINGNHLAKCPGWGDMLKMDWRSKEPMDESTDKDNKDADG